MLSTVPLHSWCDTLLPTTDVLVKECMSHPLFDAYIAELFVTTAAQLPACKALACCAQALQKEMRDQGLRMDAVTQLFVVEAAMESWCRSGRPHHILTQAEGMFERCATPGPGPRRMHKSNHPRSPPCTMLRCACCTGLLMLLAFIRVGGLLFSLVR